MRVLLCYNDAINDLRTARLIRNKIQELDFHFIDIGSGFGLDPKWKCLESRLNVIGFDPNQQECERQNNQPTAYRSAKFLPYAIGGTKGSGILYKTKSADCYSMLEPNESWLRRFSFSDKFQVEQQEQLDVVRLSDIEELRNLDVDIIKCDTQGLELPVLTHAGELLQRAFYIEPETGFCENYIGETTYSQIDEFLRTQGFLMFDINVNHRIPRNNLLQAHAEQSQVLWCESVWLKDYIGLHMRGLWSPADFSRQKMWKVLSLCAVEGCVDYGYELAEFFHQCDLLSAEELNQLKSVNAWSLPRPSQNSTWKINMISFLLRMLPARFSRAIHYASSSLQRELAR